MGKSPKTSAMFCMYGDNEGHKDQPARMVAINNIEHANILANRIMSYSPAISAYADEQ